MKVKTIKHLLNLLKNENPKLISNNNKYLQK